MLGAARIATYWDGGGGGGTTPGGPTWSLTGATTNYTGTARVGDQEGTNTDIFFKSDGTKLYAIGSTNDRVYEYALSTAWNIFTASYTTFVSIAAQETTANGIAFRSDGTAMYILGQANDTIYQYTLSTAWDLSTATYASKSFSVAGQETTPTGIDFNSSGTSVYIVGSAADTVFQYALGTAWDISTATTVGLKSFSVTAQATAPQSVRFTDSGTKFYILNQTGTGYQYACSTAYDVSTASYSSKSFAYTTATAENNFTGMFARQTGAQNYIVGTGQDFVLNFPMSTAYDITTSSFAGTDSFRVSTQEGNPQGVFMRPGGSMCFIFGDAQDRVFQYNLSSAYDINTMTYASIQSPTLTQDGSGVDIFFKSDGTAMYMLGSASDTVYQYTLSTAWNVSTATYASKSFSVTTQEASPTGLAFKTDGTLMYVVGDTSDTVYQYALSTAWDVSTASYGGVFKSVAAQEVVPTGLAFATDGLRMFVVGSNTDRVHQYTLSTAWNVSTATYDSISLSVINMDNLTSGISLAADGSRIYVVGTNLDRLVQWQLVVN